MKCHTPNILLFVGVGVVLLTWYILHDDITCIITNTESSNEAEVDVTGYYTARGGVYVRKGGMKEISVLPDFFGIVAMRREVPETDIIISQDRHRWLIQQQRHTSAGVARKELYHSLPEHAQQYLFQPPPSAWVNAETGHGGGNGLRILQCHGSLADSPPVSPPSAQSNLTILMNRPVTVLLLLLLLYVAYHLWAYRVLVSDVSFSYQAVVLGTATESGVASGREYWRAVTASVSHFEPLHLGFNCMSLYQLGELEPVYGSVSFLSLSLLLVAGTMTLCCLFYHLLIKVGKTHLITQQAVGYSCVLFAWMVAAAVRLTEFCPIFFLPSLCFPTWFIPLPLMTGAFPVNLGPFLLLFLTKLVLPQSSLTGHLAGIVLGFPLAWGLLGWVTPPLLGSVLVICFLFLEGLWVPWLPGYRRTRETRAIVDTGIVPDLRFVAIALAAWTLLLLPLSLSLFPGDEVWMWHVFSPWLWVQMTPAVSVLGMVCMSVEARRVEWLTPLRSTQQQCATVLWCALSLIALVLLCELATLCALVTSTPLLSAGPQLLSRATLTFAYITCAGILALHGSAAWLLVLQLQHMRDTDIWLKRLGLDSSSFAECFALVGRDSQREMPSGQGRLAVRESRPVNGTNSGVSRQEYSSLSQQEDLELQSPAGGDCSGGSGSGSGAGGSGAGGSGSVRGLSEAGAAALGRLGGRPVSGSQGSRK